VTGPFVRFLAWSALLVAVLVAIGTVPTRRLAGDAAIPGMIAGCLISLAAAGVAGWWLVFASDKSPSARMTTAFQAMIVRVTLVAVLGLAAALSGRLARMPLLFWLATSYVALLPLEVRLALKS
jgi:hypothetical protein